MLDGEIVPVIGCGGEFDGFKFQENKDLGRYVFDRVSEPASGRGWALDIIAELDRCHHRRR